MADGADDRPVGHLQALVGPTPDTLNQHWAQGTWISGVMGVEGWTRRVRVGGCKGLDGLCLPTSPHHSPSSHPTTHTSIKPGKANSFGFKMMMKMGWSDGRGLGKELQGNAKHVTVSKKVDNAGLGSVKDETGNAGWTEASASFDSVLNKLNARYGGQREAAQKKREKKDKKRGKESSKKKEGGTASGLLRHPKLLQSKNIRKYSAHDMQAILGIKRVEAAPVGGGEAPSLWSALAGAATGASSKGDEKESRKNEKKEKTKRERCSSSSSSNSEEEEEEEEVVPATTKKSKKQRVEQEEEETEGKAARAEKKKSKKEKRKEEKKAALEAEVSNVSEKKKNKKKKDRG